MKIRAQIFERDESGCGMGRPVLVREPCVWCGRKTARRGILSDGDLVPFCRRCHPGMSRADFRLLATTMARLEGMRLSQTRPVPSGPPPDRECGPGDFVLWCAYRLLPAWGRVLVWVAAAGGLGLVVAEFVFGILAILVVV